MDGKDSRQEENIRREINEMRERLWMNELHRKTTDASNKVQANKMTFMRLRIANLEFFTRELTKKYGLILDELQHDHPEYSKKEPLSEKFGGEIDLIFDRLKWDEQRLEIELGNIRQEQWDLISELHRLKLPDTPKAHRAHRNSIP